MSYKNFTAINTLEFGILNYDSFRHLIREQNIVDDIRSKGLVSFHQGSLLAYYVNNVLSVGGSPKWIGSFACDVSYWISEELGGDYSDIVGYIIDELWYYDYLIDGELIEQPDDSKKEELFIHRLNHWFRCLSPNGELPWNRRIDVLTP